MDVAKYQAQLEDLLSRLLGFLQDQQDEFRSSGRDAGRAERSLKFSRDLKDLNNNPFVSGLYPFEVLGKGVQLTDDQIGGVISDARDYGLGDEILLIDRGEIRTLFFSYAAEPYMPSLLKLRGLSCRNLDDRGLVMRDSHVFLADSTNDGSKLEGMLARLPGFLQDQIDEAKTQVRDAGRAQRSLQFFNDLKDLNNNPSISGLYPFGIIGNDAPLTADQIKCLLDEADGLGLGGEVMLVERSEYQIIAFSHAAEECMSVVAGLHNLPYANFDGNCLVMRGLTLVGLFSADEFTLRVFKKDAEKFLSARKPN